MRIQGDTGMGELLNKNSYRRGRSRDTDLSCDITMTNDCRPVFKLHNNRALSKALSKLPGTPRMKSWYSRRPSIEMFT